MFLLVLWKTFWRGSVNMKTLAILLGEHPCTVNILFGPMTVHYREVLLYIPLCCPSISFSFDLRSSSPKLVVWARVWAISHRCGCVLASSIGETTSVLFSRNFSTGFIRASFLMSSFLMWANHWTRVGVKYSSPSTHVHQVPSNGWDWCAGWDW